LIFFNRKIINCCAGFLSLALLLCPLTPLEAEEAEPTLLLDEIQNRAFHFFWNEANPQNGLVKDRADNFGRDNYKHASIASVGFALAALPIAIERNWISRRNALERVLVTLDFFLHRIREEHGFFFHFVGLKSGKRVWRSELSSIDTALFLAGAIVAREYFKDPTISQMVDAIYDRIDFQWMMNGGPTLTMGWKPESGFLKHRWSDFNEGILLTLLAMGSRTYPIPPEAWDHVTRRKGVYDEIVVIQSPPLFTHQYPHLFIDFRNKHDNYADYFENSINATLANRL